MQESNSSYNDQIEVEKAKTLQAGEKIKRIERDKERLTTQVNQLLSSYKQLEASHKGLLDSQHAIGEYAEKEKIDEARINQLQSQVENL